MALPPPKMGRRKGEGEGSWGRKEGERGRGVKKVGEF
jgi:hypothetical protein